MPPSVVMSCRIMHRDQKEGSHGRNAANRDGVDTAGCYFLSLGAKKKERRKRNPIANLQSII